MSCSLFGVQSARDLFQLIIDTYSVFHTAPSEKDFLFLMFSLNHLREWVAESDRKIINKKQKNNVPLTPGERFFCNIYELQEFKTINTICNGAKHYDVSVGTRKIKCARVGLLRCGDRLGQTYYLVDGKDVRGLILPLIRAYHHWFESGSLPLPRRIRLADLFVHHDRSP